MFNTVLKAPASTDPENPTGTPPGNGNKIPKINIFFTIILLVFFSVVGAFFATLFGEALEREPFWMILIPVTSAIVLGLMDNPSSAVGRKICTVFRGSLAVSGYPSGYVLFSAIGGGVISGTIVSFEVLEDVIIHPNLLLNPDYGTPVRLFVGGLLGVAIFVFRKTMYVKWGTSAFRVRGWTTRDIFIIPIVTPRQREVEGVYWQCPACYNRLSLNRKKCPSCGKGLGFISFFLIKRYWIDYRYPDGSDKLELTTFAAEAYLSNLRLKISKAFKRKRNN